MTEESAPADHDVDKSGETRSDKPTPAIEDNLKSRSTWLRLVFMLVFYVLGSVAVMVASAVIVLGFFWVLFTGETNEQLRRTGKAMGIYFAQIIDYLTFNSDARPFPFDLGWPQVEPAADD